MEESFWYQRWQNNETAFHQDIPNPILLKYFEELHLKNNSRVLVPLCGKTLDISWLQNNGYQVVGVELVETAIEQLFEEMKVEPEIKRLDNYVHYQAKGLDIIVANIFNISAEIIGKIDAVYDRAALVALPQELRKEYSRHLTEITVNAPQLCITFEYDQSIMSGPPFSISPAEMQEHYAKNYQIELLDSINVSEALKGNMDVRENVWLLKS